MALTSFFKARPSMLSYDNPLQGPAGTATGTSLRQQFAAGSTVGMGAAGQALEQLKRTADRLVEEQQSTKTATELFKHKLQESESQVRNLEAFLIQERNENAQLRAKVKDDQKQIQSIAQMVCSVQDMQDSLRLTLHEMACSTEEVEEKRSQLSAAFDVRFANYEDTVNKLDVTRKLREQAASKLEEVSRQHEDLLREMHSLQALLADKESSCSLQKAQLDELELSKNKACQRIEELLETLRQADCDNAKLAEEVKCAFDKHEVDDKVKAEQLEHIQVLRDDIKSLDKKLSDVHLSLSKETALKADLAKKVAELEAQIAAGKQLAASQASASRALKEANESAAKKMQNFTERAAKELDSLRMKSIADLDQEKSKMQTLLEAAEAKKQEVAGQLEESAKHITKLLKELEMAKKEATTREEQIAEERTKQQNEMAALHDNIQKLKQQLEEDTQCLTSKLETSEKEAVQKQAIMKRDHEKELTERTAEFTTRLLQCKQEMDTKRAALEQVQERLRNAESDIEAARDAASCQEMAIQELQEELAQKSSMLQKISVVAGVIGGSGGGDLARKTPSAKTMPRSTPPTDGKKLAVDIKGKEKGSKEIQRHSPKSPSHGANRKTRPAAAVKRMPMKTKAPPPCFHDTAPCSQSQPASIRCTAVEEPEEGAEENKENAQGDDKEAENTRQGHAVRNKRKLRESPAKTTTQRNPASGAARRTMFASMCTTSSAPPNPSSNCADADSRPTKPHSRSTVAARAATKVRDGGRGNKKKMRVTLEQQEVNISEYNSAAMDLFGHASFNPYAFAV